MNAQTLIDDGADLRHAHVTATIDGRKLLGTIKVQSQLYGIDVLHVRYFNGEPWPWEWVMPGVCDVLERTYESEESND